MNFGGKINELRKSKKITQDELAAELGVTAAAVSKWENGYTLPDILMLCALADYFQVSTDELLGRIPKQGMAVIVAEKKELGEKIKALAAQFGIETAEIYDNIPDAVTSVVAKDGITHLLIASLNSNYPHMQIHVDSKTLHLAPELCFNLESKVFHLSPDKQVDLGAREIKLYISISDTEQEILTELRSALRNEG